MTPPSQDGHVATPTQASERLPGYLEPSERPDSLALLPPPPAEDSAAFASDVKTYRETRALRDSSRWEFAANDGDVNFPQAANRFACALGTSVTLEHTPTLYRMLQRIVMDASKSTSAAKDKYVRVRPFVAYGDSTCVPKDESSLRTNGSYPSGHASLGWAWALTLANLAPTRADAIEARGLAFGQSRVICGLHWQSDVDAGRRVGAAVYERLLQDPEFVADLARARDELRAATTDVAPAQTCEAERRVLGP